MSISGSGFAQRLGRAVRRHAEPSRKAVVAPAQAFVIAPPVARDTLRPPRTRGIEQEVAATPGATGRPAAARETLPVDSRRRRRRTVPHPARHPRIRRRLGRFGQPPAPDRHAAARTSGEDFADTVFHAGNTAARATDPLPPALKPGNGIPGLIVPPGRKAGTGLPEAMALPAIDLPDGSRFGAPQDLCPRRMDARLAPRRPDSPPCDGGGHAAAAAACPAGVPPAAGRIPSFSDRAADAGCPVFPPD